LYSIAGFAGMVDARTSVGELRDRVRAFVHARDWEQFHGPKDLAMAISIEASELLERFLWRPPGPPGDLSAEDRSAVAEELADVLIYGLSLANTLDLDLSEAILAKLRKDEAKYPVDRFRGRAR
jgi:dCTP diphosphatase